MLIRKRILRVVAIPAVAVLAICGTALSGAAGTASAATAPAQASVVRSNPGAIQESTQLLATPTTFKITTTTASAPSKAGDPCSTGQRVVTAYDYLDLELFWSKMQTSWCWDYRTVTSHTTNVYWGRTTLGEIDGWQMENVGRYFECYVASGSTRECSGNHEIAQFDWFNGTSECIQAIQEWENYRGEFFSGGSEC